MPTNRAGGLTDFQRKIILALAVHDMCIQRAADTMFYSAASVKYHIDKIRAKTGLNPQRFYDLIKLVEMAKEEDNAAD